MMNLGNLRRTFVLVGFSMLLCEDCCVRINFGFVIIQFSKNAQESGKMHSDATFKNVKKKYNQDILIHLPFVTYFLFFYERP